MGKSDIANTTVLSSAISLLISSVGFVAMPATWLVTVLSDSAERTLEMRFQVASVRLNDALVVAMPLTGNMRFAQLHLLFSTEPLTNLM